MEIRWHDGYRLSVRIAAGEAVISGNREGLLSLAEQLSALAKEEKGSHIHYDGYNSLEEGSTPLVIEKI